MGGDAAPGNDAGLRTLVLRERHEAAGARFAPFAGWEMPLQYEGTVREHEAVRQRVGLFDVSHLGRAWLRGPQAASLLRSVTTFDVTTLEAGRAHYSLYCNDAGGIDDDVFVYHLPGERWLIVHNAANAEQDFERLRAVADDAEEVTRETVMLAVQGPDAIGLLSDVLGEGLARWRRGTARSWTGMVRRFCSLGRATRVRTAASASSTPAGPARCGTHSWTVEPPLRASAPATRCGSRRHCRCTATTSTPPRIPTRPGSDSL